MKDSDRRLEELVRRGEMERRALAGAVGEIAEEVRRRRAQWRIAGLLAGGLAAAATAVYKLFGKGSLAAKVGRYSSAASLVLGLTRAALRLRRFL
jgi:hypothetical protein